MEKQIIGVIDSGVGGLSVLHEIHKLLPHDSLHYIADSAWCPYGPRPAEEIKARVAELSDYLIEQGVQAIVIACNSATIVAIESLRASYPIPFIGMEPAVKPAAQITQSGTIGVLATEASLAGEKMHHLISNHASDVRVITRPCPEFVTLVEAGKLKGDEVERAIEKIITPLLDEGADVLVLGCTHYPFLRSSIEKIAGPEVTVLDTGQAVARRLASLLEPSPPTETSRCHIQTTGDLTLLESLIPQLYPDSSVTLSPLDLA